MTRLTLPLSHQVVLEKSRLASVLAAKRAGEAEGRAVQAAVQGVKEEHSGWVIKLENVKLEIQNLTLQKMHLEQQNAYQPGANSQQNIYNMYGPFHGGVPMPSAFSPPTQNNRTSATPSFASPVHHNAAPMSSAVTTSAATGLQGHRQSFSHTAALPLRGPRYDTASSAP